MEIYDVPGFGYTLAHAQTVCTRPSFGPGDEASIRVD